MEERTFEDILQALMEDPDWEIPQEERPALLETLAWTLNEV